MREDISVVRIGQVLQVVLLGSVSDNQILELLERLPQSLSELHPQGLIIDLASLDVIDSFLARTFQEIASIAGIMGVETVISGIRPAVAMTMAEMGLELQGIKMALNLDHAWSVLFGKSP